MFTGLVEEIGRVVKAQSTDTGLRIEVCCSKVLSDMNIGDSVAVNGVCLTAIQVLSQSFVSEVISETLVKTTFSDLKEDQYVNLERSLLLTSRIGGHLMQGHVEGVAILHAISKEQDGIVYCFRTEKEHTHYMISKGSIAIDGVSLTIVDVSEDCFSVALIDHTLANTIFSQLRIGDKVNIECDIIGKYIEKWAGRSENYAVSYRGGST